MLEVGADVSGSGTGAAGFLFPEDFWRLKKKKPRFMMQM